MDTDCKLFSYYREYPTTLPRVIEMFITDMAQIIATRDGSIFRKESFIVKMRRTIQKDRVRKSVMTSLRDTEDDAMTNASSASAPAASTSQPGNIKPVVKAGKGKSLLKPKASEADVFNARAVMHRALHAASVRNEAEVVEFITHIRRAETIEDCKKHNPIMHKNVVELSQALLNGAINERTEEYLNSVLPLLLSHPFDNWLTTVTEIAPASF